MPCLGRPACRALGYGRRPILQIQRGFCKNQNSWVDEKKKKWFRSNPVDLLEMSSWNFCFVSASVYLLGDRISSPVVILLYSPRLSGPCWCPQWRSNWLMPFGTLWDNIQLTGVASLRVLCFAQRTRDGGCAVDAMIAYHGVEAIAVLGSCSLNAASTVVSRYLKLWYFLLLKFWLSRYFFYVFMSHLLWIALLCNSCFLFSWPRGACSLLSTGALWETIRRRSSLLRALLLRTAPVLGKKSTQWV